MLLRPTLTGRHWTILVVEDERGRCQVEEFVEDLRRDNPAEYKKLVQRVQRIADHGDPRNEELFKHLWDDLWEIKTTRTRVICWRGKRTLVLLEAFIKKSDRIQPQVQQRVNEIADTVSWLAAEYERSTSDGSHDCRTR